MRSISIALPTIRALFQTDEDVYGSRPRFESGINEIVKRISYDTQYVYIGLPEEHIHKNTHADVERAIRHYCAYKIRDIHHQRHVLRDTINKSTIMALSIITVTTILSFFLGKSFLHEQYPWATSVIIELLILIGWVSMWRPIEYIVYRQWEAKRDELHFTKLKKAIISVIPEESLQFESFPH